MSGRRPPPVALAAAAGVAAGLALYLPTAARTVGFIDRGELAAVAVTLGIAHPTGYPTFTLLGHAWTRLFPAAPLIALDVLAALLGALGVGGLTLLDEHVIARLAPALAPGRRAMLALWAALATGVSAFWWQQANGWEVYALQALLLPLVTWAFLRWVDARPPGSFAARRGAVFAFTLGVAFTNHMTTLLLAPAFLFYYFARSGWRRASFARLLPMIPPFLLGLSPYLYLPLRASQHPRFDWGDPEVAWRFLSHVSGWQFQVWMFESWSEARAQLAFLMARLPGELAYGGVLLAALGVGRMARGARALLAWTLLVGIACGVCVAGYAIRDIDSYTLPAMLALGALMAAGLIAVHERLGFRAAFVAGAALALAGVALHVGECDEHDETLADHLTRDVFRALPARAIFISSQWDCVVSPSYYLQTAEGLRPDVLVVDPELMRRSWYVAELARRAPAFFAGFAPEARAFARTVEPFERRRPFDAQALERTYQAMLGAMVDRSLAERPVMVSSEVQGAWLPDARVPLGLAYRIAPDTTYQPATLPITTWRRWGRRIDPYVATTSALYAEPLWARAEYEAAHGDSARARAYRRAALAFDPHLDPGRVPPLALDGRDIVLRQAEFFERLRSAAGE